MMDHACPACRFTLEEKGLKFKTWPGKRKFLPLAIGWGCPRCGVLLTINRLPAEKRMNIVFMLMILAAVLLLESFGPLAFLVWAVLIPVPDWAFQRWVRRRLATWKRYALADWSGRKRSG